MNEIVNKVLLAEDKYMPEMHLKQPRFTYSACGSFTENKERIQKFKETGDSRYIYKNELEKSCFQHDMTYEDLAKRAASDKVLRDKAFNIAKDIMMDIKEVLLLWFISSLIEKPLVVVSIIKLNKINNLQMNFINQLLENFKKEEFILHLKIIFGVLI